MDTKREHRTHAEGSPRGNPYDLTYSPSGRLIGKFRDNNSVTLSASVDMAYGYCDSDQPHAVRRIYDHNNGMLYDMRWDGTNIKERFLIRADVLKKDSN